MQRKYNGQEHENFLNWIRELSLVEPILMVSDMKRITGRSQMHIRRALNKIGDSKVRHEKRASVRKEELEKLLQDANISRADICSILRIRSTYALIQIMKRMCVSDPYPSREVGKIGVSLKTSQELQAILDDPNNAHLAYAQVVRRVGEKTSTESLKRLLSRGDLVDRFFSATRIRNRKEVDVEELKRLRKEEPSLSYTELRDRLGVIATSTVIYWCTKLGIEKSEEEVEDYHKRGVDPELIRKTLEDNPTLPLADIAVMVGYSYSLALIDRMRSAGIVDRFKDTRPRRKAYLPKYRSMLESALADPELKSLSYSNILERVGILHFVGTGALSSAIWRGTITDAFREHRISVNLRGRPTRSKKEKASE